MALSKEWVAIRRRLSAFGCKSVKDTKTGKGIPVKIEWNTEDREYWFTFKDNEDWQKAEGIKK